MFTPYPIFNPFPWPTSLSRKQVQNLEASLFLGPFVIWTHSLSPVPSAYWPQARISKLEGSIFRLFWIFDLFPQPTGLWLGSQIQNGLFSDPSGFFTQSFGLSASAGISIPKGLFSDPSGFSTHSLGLLALGRDLKFGRVYFQTLVHFQPIP
jgi:hypothetical protein